MTIDVEDWFQVSSLEGLIDRKNWGDYPLMVERNVDRILALLSGRGVGGTFFILGWLAQRLPRMVRRIAAEGHEIGSHGWDHRRLSDMDRESFRSDVERTRKSLQDVTGEDVPGYRAPSFSVNHQTPWAHEILVELGHRYSSSVAPFQHDHYGWPTAPRFAWQPIAGSSFVELPVSSVCIGARRMPVGGGGFFRLYPYALSRALLHKVNAEQRPAIFYLHPWELDPRPTSVRGIRRRTKWRMNIGRRATAPRLERLLREFNWGRLDEIVDRERERCQ